MTDCPICFDMGCLCEGDYCSTQSRLEDMDRAVEKHKVEQAMSLIGIIENTLRRWSYDAEDAEDQKALARYSKLLALIDNRNPR